MKTIREFNMLLSSTDVAMVEEASNINEVGP